MGYSRKEQFLRLFEACGALNELQALVHFVVVFKEGVALSDLLKAVLEWSEEQFVLNIGVRFEQILKQGGERFDFANGFEVGDRSFDMIE